METTTIERVRGWLWYYAERLADRNFISQFPAESAQMRERMAYELTKPNTPFTGITMGSLLTRYSYRQDPALCGCRCHDDESDESCGCGCCPFCPR